LRLFLIGGIGIIIAVGLSPTIGDGEHGLGRGHVGIWDSRFRRAFVGLRRRVPHVLHLLRRLT